MATTQTPPAAVAPARILIVEDEGIIANHIATRLVKTGYEVAGIAESSEEALIKTAASAPDLVLMDIRIKGSTDGIETAIRIQERFDVPVIYLTAHSDQETIDRAKTTGAFGFLTKPIHHTSLSTSIEMSLHKHRADREVRRQRAWLATILGTMADAVIVIDADRMVRFMNAPAEALTGWTNESSQGREIASVLPLMDSPSGEAANESLFPEAATGTPRQLQRGLIASHRSGRWFPLEGEIAPSMDGERSVGTVITFRDATIRQEHEAALRHEYKMQAVGRLAAGIAHDFNNLLFVILGYTDEMLHKAVLNDNERHALAEIRKAGDDAAHITQQLLNFSRKEHFDKQDVNLNDVIRDTSELVRRLGGPRIKWQFRLNSELAVVKADPGQLKQILMNLVANARDAMPEGGKITIETATVEAPLAGVSMPLRESVVALSVTDTGVGMSTETAEHLFEPFFTTKTSGKGTGLGLSIVHSIVTDLGGTIHVDSEPGKGTTFTVYISLAGAEAHAPEAFEAARPGSHEPHIVLLVEDQAAVRSLLRGYLESSGYNVLEAESGSEGVEIANNFGSRIDLLITDAVMPGMGGFDLAHALSQRKEMKIIFVSGYAQELLDETVNLPAGAQFLPKPFLKKDLLKAVRDMLHVSGSQSVRMSA